ncbi:MAG: hypothetical protein CL840_06220 [Crocinitomicaceae bacterium]|nr:hypothetical protein [Crocinitomicaceae bacterium]|tara:strand:+ start:1081 stop:3150 length:2070 start_codon:yes stop_codon:yes gene_type:complete
MKRRIHSLLVLVLSIWCFASYSQEECDEDVSQKAVNLCTKGKDKKKYSKEKRMAYLRDALEEEEDFAEANFLLGIETIKTAMYKGTGHGAAIKYFEKTATLCPEFHSDMYYYLGAIYYGRNDYENAVKYQEKFLDFQSDDGSKFSKKYETYLVQTEEDYKTAKFFADGYAHPVPFDPQVIRDVSTNEAEEYLPLLSPDNELLLFTRKWEAPAKKGSYISSDQPTYIEKFSIARLLDGKFEKGEPMPEPFNIDDKINYGGVTLSLNNRHMYLTICTPYNDKGTIRKNCDIYRSNYIHGLNKATNREEMHWTEPENLGPNINTPRGWESQPSLSSDGKHLYFASYREGSEKIDIYMSEMNADGEWGMAKSLGPPINTPENDKAPFIHTDSKSLYFASRGHQTFGAYDVFFSRQKDDGTWSEPKNVGYPINTDEDEHGFMVSADGKKAYYASNHFKNKRTVLNILSFDLYKEVRPDQVVMVKGNVKQENVSVENKKVSLKNMSTKKVSEFEIESDGTFAAAMVVKPGDKVIMKVEGDDVAYNARVVNVPEEEAEEVSTEAIAKPIAQQLDVVIEEEEVGGNYKLEDIHYETNSAEISDRSQVILDDFAEYLIKNSSIKVAIHGHTDNVGSSSDNLALSTDRAFSIKTYLQNKGVASQRLTFKGFGDEKPIADNSSESGRSLNRRTEFMILSK